MRCKSLFKNQHFQIPIRSGTNGQVSMSSYELLSDPWVNKLQFTIYNFFVSAFYQTGYLINKILVLTKFCDFKMDVIKW